MTRLESTLIKMANWHLDNVLSLYAAQKAEIIDEDELNEGRSAQISLFCLLELGHLRDSGMSPEGITAMQEIEARHSAAVREITENE